MTAGPKPTPKPAAKPATTVAANGTAAAKPATPPAIIEFVDDGFTGATLLMTLVGGVIVGALVVWAINRFVVIEDDHHA